MTVPTNLQIRWQNQINILLQVQQELMSQGMSPLWSVASPLTWTLDPWHKDKEILDEDNYIINWIWAYLFKQTGSE